MKRLYNAIHYIIERQPDYTKLGKVKLNKILWFADREMMYKDGSTITHSQYIKLPNGPAPKKIEAILKALIADGKIVPKENFVRGYKQNSFVSIKSPDIGDFSQYEISILDKYADEIVKISATEVSSMSHDESWAIAKLGDIIPVETVFLADICQPTAEDLGEARRLFDS